MVDNILTDEQINEAKKHVPCVAGDPNRENPGCVRIAYEWLDAQAKTVSPIRSAYAIKHLIEKWGARYVSQYDVEVAAYLHPQIKGKYPYYNISSKLTLPSEQRLAGIEEAFTQMNYRDRPMYESYKYRESV